MNERRINNVIISKSEPVEGPKFWGGGEQVTINTRSFELKGFVYISTKIGGGGIDPLYPLVPPALLV